MVLGVALFLMVCGLAHAATLKNDFPLTSAPGPALYFCFQLARETKNLKVKQWHVVGQIKT